MKSYFKFLSTSYKYIKENDEDAANLFAVIICTLVFTAGITADFIRDNNLHLHHSYTLGVVTEVRPMSRWDSIFFDYYVEGKLYKGSTSQGLFSKIKVGDSLIVIYEYSNPGHEEVYSYFEYTLDRSKLPDSVFYRQRITQERKPLDW